MDINKAEKITKLMNKINRCKDFLKSLDGRSYDDEFVIYYRGYETCELESVVLEIIIKHYKTQLAQYEKELQSL